ncbi:MAG: 2-dehydropantoate 2-reductase [Sulfobacillus sp.]
MIALKTICLKRRWPCVLTDNRTERMPQRVAVIGGGAVGCYIASQSYAAGHEVILCLRTSFDRLIVDSSNISEEVPVTITTEPDRQTIADWVLITTKAQDTLSTMPWLAHLVGSHTVVVLLQNGINHQERLHQVVQKEFILPGLVYVAVERVAPGHIVHRGGSRILVPDTEHGESFRKLLLGSNTQVLLESDFRTAAWKKLLSNLAANPITALTLQRIGILQHPDVEALSRGLLQEGVAVGRAAGAILGADDIDQTLALYAQFEPNSGTSMLYDRLAGRPLEHEYIGGAVVSAGEKYGVPTPLNRVLLTLLRELK